MIEIPTADQHPNLQYMRRALQRCKGFGLYFARCNTSDLRTELVAALKENLTAPIVELTLNPDNDIFIDVQMAQLLETAPDDAIVFIYDIEKLFYLKDRHLLAELNWRRGFYGRMNHPVVFWLPEFLLVELFQNAPDFMDWRSGVYEFSLSQPEKQNLTESTWQSANESFIGSLSLQEKERWIVNLNNLLSELDGEESKIKSELLNRLGLLYDSLGQYDKAFDCYQQNLSVQQTIGDKEGEGVTLNNLSQIYAAKGDYDTALRYLEQSLKIDHELGDKKGEGTTLNNISQIYDAKGDYDSALRYLEQALKIQQDIGDKQGEGTTLNNISQIYNAKGDYDSALRYLEQALKIGQDIGDKKGESTRLNNISSIYQARGDYDSALRYLEQSLKIQQDIGDLYGESVTLFNLGYLYESVGNQQKALSCWQQSYKIVKKLGLAKDLQDLEKIAKRLGGTGLEFWERLSESGFSE